MIYASSLGVNQRPGFTWSQTVLGPTHVMPPRKRSAPSVDIDSASQGDREVKKQKTTPHRSKWAVVVQDLLNLLSPATNESLANFNDEEEEIRYGVVPMDILVVPTELKRLRVVKDIESLGARLEKIDSYLKDFQDGYDDYLVRHHQRPKWG